MDQTLLLFAFDISPVWRHSFTATYVVYSPATNTSTIVTDQAGSSTLQYCDWVDNNDFDNTLIYVSKEGFI